MDDFTKKELIALEDAMEKRLIDHPTQNGESPLLKKIQFMIDNYCEHKETVCIGGFVQKCVKCGIKFGDETL